MTRSIVRSIASIALILLLASTTSAGTHGRIIPEKKGILLVAFGTTVPEARASFAEFEKKAVSLFNDIPVRWAYTSHIVRRKLAKEGIFLDSVETALSSMMDEGFTHVAIQSLHTIPGREFQDLKKNALLFEQMTGGFSRVSIGGPLLSSGADMERVSDAVVRNLSPGRKKEEAVVLMGHGTTHSAHVFYTALAFHLQRKDPLIFVGTVEGTPGLDETRSMLQEKGVSTAYLIPFMAVAGDHARNDMAGDDPESWKSVLTRAGIRVVPVLKGTAEYEDMTDIWLDHLEQAVLELK